MLTAPEVLNMPPAVILLLRLLNEPVLAWRVGRDAAREVAGRLIPAGAGEHSPGLSVRESIADAPDLTEVAWPRDKTPARMVAFEDDKSS